MLRAVFPCALSVLISLATLVLTPGRSRAADAPRPRQHVSGSDIVFQAPYVAPMSPSSAVMEATTSFPSVDLYFLIDHTGSMAAELEAMRSQLSNIVDTLQCTPSGTCAVDGDCPPGSVCADGSCVALPGSPACAPDIWTGIGQFDECNTYLNLVSVQADPAVTAAAVPFIGAGVAEAPYQAVAQVADPGYGSNTPGCSPSGIGCPGFRPDALRVLIQITDADNQASAACSIINSAIAGNALRTEGIVYAAVVGSDDDSAAPGTPLSMAQLVGSAAGSVDALGQPFVRLAQNAALPGGVLEVVRSVLEDFPGPVTLEVLDEAGDAVDARVFIDHVEVNVSGAGACTSGLATEDTNGDGYDDAFVALPGTPVCWTIVPVAQNNLVAPMAPESYAVQLVVRARGVPVHTARVVFEVPPFVAAVEPGSARGVVNLAAPRPSPAAGSTAIEYSVLAGSPVSIRVFDGQGRLVRGLLEETASSGPGVVIWDGRDDSGVRLRPGVYHVHLRAGADIRTRKLTLLE